jgi:putative transposase
MQLKKTRWSTYNINYHFVWIPKYRRKILVDEIKQELEKIFKDISEKHEIEILSLSIQPDHIHLFVSAPPRLAPADIVNLFKGISSKKLIEKFSHLKTKHGLWSRTYYVGTAGTVSEETIRRYIEECQDI